MFPGLQGGPLEHVIAAKAVAFAEAARPEFRTYAAQVVANAAALGASLADQGIRLVSGGTENHQVLVDLRTFDVELTGKVAQEVLDRAGITCNRNTIPDDPRSAFITSGLRLGSAAQTTAGMGAEEMALIGALIGRTLRHRDDERTVAAIRPRCASCAPGSPRTRPWAGCDRTGPGARVSGVVPLNWYGVLLVVAAVAAWVLTFPARRLAVQVGYVSQPDERKVHQRVTPAAGGAAMFVAMLVTWAAAASIPALSPLFRGSSEPLGLILGAAVIFVVGIIDDFRDMSAPAKVAGEVLAATVLVLHGRDLVPDQGAPGRDGPALAGVDPAADRPVGHRHHQRGQPDRRPGRPGRRGGGHRLGGPGRLRPPPPAPGHAPGRQHRSAHRGDHLRHLPRVPAPQLPPGQDLHGRRRRPAARPLHGRLDHAHRGSGRDHRRHGQRGGHALGQTYFFYAPLFIPFFILGVPMVDMAFAFVRRTANRTGFSTPDKNHLHHRLLRLGHGHRRSVLILWAWTLLLSGFILFPLYISSVNAIIPFGALALGVILYTLFHPSLRREADPGPEEEADHGPTGGSPGPTSRPMGPGPGPMPSPGPPRGPIPPPHRPRPSRRRPACRPRWPAGRPTASAPTGSGPATPSAGGRGPVGPDAV